MLSHLDGVVGVGDDCDEQAEDHVDEERHKGVEVNPAEDPHHAVLVLHVLEGGKHVVSVDQGEETLGHRVQGAELCQRDERIFYFLAKASRDLCKNLYKSLLTFSWYGPSTIQPQKQ